MPENLRDRYKVKYDRESKTFFIEETEVITTVNRNGEKHTWTWGVALNWETKSEQRAGRYCARLNKLAMAP